MVDDVHVALTALEFIEGDSAWLRSYLTGDYAKWPNVVAKTRVRSRRIVEMAKLISECMDRIDEEKYAL